MDLQPLSELANTLPIGSEYEHYKGHRYKILAIARHSETLEEMVVYQAVDGERAVWVRPLAMFLENVIVDGQTLCRFKLVKQ